jgi:hypothetical protein
MALTWTDFNNGEQGLSIRNKINTFNNDVVLNYKELQRAVAENRIDIIVLQDKVNLLEQEVQGKENWLGVPKQDKSVLLGNTDGTREWGNTTIDITIEWGNLVGDISNQTDLFTILNEKSDTTYVDAEIEALADATYQVLLTKADINHNHDNVYFKRDEFIATSAGIDDAGKPIILNSKGLVDASMLDMDSGFTNQGDFTPTDTAEYPDTTGLPSGSFWTVVGVDNTNGYTFTGGDLAGETAHNGNLMVWAGDSWSLRVSDINPFEYYKLDGSQAITGPFAGGGQQLKNIAPATENGDAVEWSQVSSMATDYVRHDGSTIMTGSLDMGNNRVIQLAEPTQTNDAVTKQYVDTTTDPVGSADAVQTNLDTHTSDTANPHSVTKDQVGLGNVDNTSDIDKPISTATQTALDSIKTGTKLIGDTIATEDGTYEYAVNTMGIESGTYTGVDGCEGFWRKLPDGSFDAWGKAILRLGSGSFTHILDISDQPYPVTPIQGSVFVTGIPNFSGSASDGSNFRENMSIISFPQDDKWRIDFISGGEDFSAEVGKTVSWHMVGRWK